MNEHRRRSLLKAFSWRAIATTTTIILVFVATREWTLSISVGVFDAIAKLVLYYGHERIWNIFQWGRNKK